MRVFVTEWPKVPIPADECGMSEFRVLINCLNHVSSNLTRYSHIFKKFLKGELTILITEAQIKQGGYHV